MLCGSGTKVDELMGNILKVSLTLPDVKWSTPLNIEMSGRYLPKDRRDLTIRMVRRSVNHLFLLLCTLKLYKSPVLQQQYLSNKDMFSHRLFKLVSRRHTHLWNRPLSTIK
jgi:hypothetical protein